MPKGHAATSLSPKRRYAAAVEKGENAWRREWSSFMSGVDMKELRKGGGVVLPKSADLEIAELNNNNNNNNSADVGVGRCNFSYLFASPAEKKASRLAKQREDEERRKRRALEKAKRSGDPLAHLSKHERSLTEARRRGLNIDGMTRREVREFLHLTVSKQQREAERRRGDVKPHELMDGRLQWYQQGPHPIDVIAEKLVVRKAAKRAKQLGLRYNYLMPHASWLAKREQRRRESVLVGLGRRFIFDEEGRAMDVFGNYVHTLSSSNNTTSTGGGEAVEEEKIHEVNNHPMKEEEGKERNTVPAAAPPPPHMTAAPAAMHTDALVDPRQASTSYVRSVVRNRKVADAIKTANITTSYISSSLVMGPSIGLEDCGENGAAQRSVKTTAAPPRRVKAREPRSKAASFEP